MTSAQQQVRRPQLRSPQGLLRVMTGVIVALMVLLCGVSMGGLLSLQGNVAAVTRDNVPALSALNDARIAFLNVQRDNRQAWFDSDAALRMHDIALIQGNVAQVQSAISAYLGLVNELDKPLALANLKQTTAVWLAFEHILISDLFANSERGNADAITLINGFLATQEQKLTDLLVQSQQIEQGEVSAIHANAYTTSQHIVVMLLGVGVLAIFATLFGGIGTTRHLARVYAQIGAINQQLAMAVEDTHAQNEELAAQQSALLQTNAALEVAIDERHQAEARLVGALDESERLGRYLQAIFASVQDALLVVDAQGNERYRNHACELLLEITAEDRIDVRHPSRSFYALDGQPIPPELMPVGRALNGNVPDAPTTCLLHFADGRRKVVRIEVSPISAVDGTMASLLVVMRDITTTYREERHKEILQLLAHYCALALTEEEIAQTAAHILKAGLSVAYCTIFVRRLERPSYAQCLGIEVDAGPYAPQATFLEEALDRRPISPDAPIAALQVIATGEPRLHATADAEAASFPVAQLMILPLRNNAQTFGALEIGFAADAPQSFAALDDALLHTVADEIAVALHRARLHAEVQALAFHDPLTGLYNHRALQQHLHEAMAVAQRDGLPLSVIMIDVDHFRSFNEVYGHDIGDRALQTVAQAIESALRAQDVAARYGGEEFTVLLPDTRSEEALLIAERIRLSVAAARIPVPDDAGAVPISASLGVATAPLHATEVSALLKAADIALYEAKHRGRDQVCGYSESITMVIPLAS